jgi:lysophospholipase L1-like esterase
MTLRQRPFATLAKYSITAALVFSAPFVSVAEAQSTNSAPSQHRNLQASATAPGILFHGRFDMSNPAEPAFAWSGSRITIRFKASAIAVNLDANGIRFRVSVDGQLSDFIATSATTYNLATDLSTAQSHQVSLWRQTEARQGVARFLGVTFPAGGALERSPTVAARKIEVIGDSISTGYGNEGPAGCTGYSVTQQNHWMSYGAIAARAKAANLITVAWAGKGLYRNYDGTTAATGDTMPELYPRTLPSNATSTWNFATDIPQAVIINLGTNDYHGSDPGSDFNNTYIDFVRTIRTYYPAAKIFVALTPMLSGTNRTSLATRLKAVVNTLNVAHSDPNVYYIDLKSQGTSRGCDNHPNIAHHQVMAGVVNSALQQRLGW